MSEEHFKAAAQALVMDAPRMMRGDMTKLSEMLAKYSALEATFNEIGNEDSGELMSGLMVPIVNLRAAIEGTLEKLAEGNAPTLSGMDPDRAAGATEVAFDLEDALMAWINENQKLPAAVAVRSDLYALLQEAWPDRDNLQLPKGTVALQAGPEGQTDSFVFLGA